MSVSDKEISSVGDSGVGVSGSGGGDDHDDDDDDDEKKNSGGVHQKANYDDQRTKQRAIGYNNFSGFLRNLRKAKKLVQRPFKTKLSGKSKSSSSFSGKRIDVDNVGGNKGCCFCFTPTPSGESAAIGSQSQNSDPNHPTFTYDMLRVLIEKSDFHSKECNSHLDSDVSLGEE